MKLSAKSWENYISKLAELQAISRGSMQKYINNVGEENVEDLINFAYALATKYGEGAGALACDMYDAIAEASGKALPPAEVAQTATYRETAIAVQGTMVNKQSTIPDTVSRLVKQAAADTTLKNALRDGAKFAWIPHGDTCAFCLTIASRGWQNISKKSLKNGHAEHIHPNCNCEYAVSFDENPSVEGYDPSYYKDIYDSAKGKSSKDKINYLRRKNYADIRGRGEDAVKDWAGEKIKKSLGGDYEEFEKLVNNAGNKGLYNQYSEFPTYYQDRKDFYRRAEDAVHYGVYNREGANKFSSLAHENGHMFDHHMGRVPGLDYSEVDLINQRCVILGGRRLAITPMPSNSGEFLKALREDMRALAPKVRDRSIRDELLATNAKRNATAGIQDALDGFYNTQDRSILPWGHGGRYYNRVYNARFSANKVDKELKQAFLELGFDASNQAKVKSLSRVYEAASEAWANISSAVTCGGDELKYVKQYMPKTYEAYMRIIGE